MTTPRGFRYAGVAAGLKGDGAPDVGLLVSDVPAVAAGVVTTNRFLAAPVRVSAERLARGTARVVVVNAKNANACTGAQGIEDARAQAAAAAAALGIDAADVLVASTGVIGRPMPMDRIRDGVQDAAAALAADPMPLARSMMTTDTRPKLASAAAGGATVFGVAKGAGMIAPEMATMLCFVATDAAVDAGSLRTSLQHATASTFNTISVDGCMSTNDCIFALANGLAGPVDAAAFDEALREVLASLARQVVEDGEGITKVVAVTVRGAANDADARVAARTIADSVLLRCAIGGADPNWGRVLAALGTTTVAFDPDAVDVWVAGEHLAAGGAPGPGDLDKAALAMQEREIEIVAELHAGDGTATVLTNDLTAEYVRINADYTS